MNLRSFKLTWTFIFFALLYSPWIFAQCYVANGVRWPANASTVTYHINSGLATSFATQQDYENAIDSAAAQWDNAGANFKFAKGSDVNYSQGNEPSDISQVGYYINDQDSSNAITVPYVWDGTDTLAKVETYLNQAYIFSANPNSDELDIWTTAAHEFGHWLDLLDETDPSCSQNVMYKYLANGNTSRRYLTQDDKDGIISIYGDAITGIKDYITITEDLNYYNVNQYYLNYIHASFVDEDGDGGSEGITSWDNWQIKASYSCGEVLLYDNPSPDFELPNLPSGYLWNRDANGYVIGTLSIGGTDNDGVHHTASMPIKIGNVPNTFITSGTLTSNTTWCGDVSLTGTITVPSGIMLTINAGANIEFPNNASLVVNGQLNAQFCTFTSTGSTNPGSWSTISFNGSGANGSSIQYADIQYGTEIDVANANDVTIQGCNITNSSMRGISFSGGSGSVINNTIKNSNTAHGIVIQNGANVICTGNVLKKTNLNQQGVGIYFGGGGTGIAAQNDIDGFNWGICAIWGSSPSSHNVNYPARNNRITNCSVGLDVYYNSYPTFGIPTPGDTYGMNSIYSNTFNVLVGISYPTIGSGLYGCYNWWGNNPPNTSLFSVGSASYFYYTPYEQSDPWTGIPQPSIKQVPVDTASVKLGNQIAVIQDSKDGGIQNSSVNIPGLTDSLFTGIVLRDGNILSDAKELFISYLKNHPDNQAAYTYLYSCADSSTIPDIISFFNSLPSKASKEQKLLLSYLYLKEGNEDMAKKVNNDINTENPNTPLSERATLNNFYIALYNDHDLKTASTLLNEVENSSDLSTPMEVATAENDYNVYGNMIAAKTSTPLPSIQQSSTVVDKPKVYSLLQNFPNPFNPTTVISYQIPNDGFVSLKIYDLLGRNVKTLVSEFKSQGRYSVSFDASQLSSGVYFYQLKAGDYTSIKKMVLLK